MKLVLASQSASRRAMLDAAGVHYSALPARLDETGLIEAMQAQGCQPRDIADRLAELKALKVSGDAPGALVLGSDSILVLATGELMEKPPTREAAQAQLAAMSAGRHQLVSAAVIVEDGRPVWRHVGSAVLHVRMLSPSFIQSYLDAEWPAIAGCVGCFRIEGPGVQLFDRIAGDHFIILGMPLLPVLGYLRLRGLMPA